MGAAENNCSRLVEGVASTGTARRWSMETSQLVRTRTRLGPTLALDQWIPNIQPGQHQRTMVSPLWGRMGSGRCADVDRSRG